MNIKTKAIVLSVIKYNDSDVIVKTFTQETGFTGYYVKGLLKKKKAKLKKAFLQPNTLIEIVASHKNKGQLEYLKEVNPYYHYKNLNTDFDKLSISTFIREILIESLKNEQADPRIYHYIEQLFIRLDQSSFDPNIHLIFLLELSTLLGFQPQTDSDGIYFDMENGLFTDKLPLGIFLNKSETLLLKQLLGMIFAYKSPIKLSNLERKKGIDFMLKYYQLHIEHFAIPKSLKILNQIYQ